MVSQLSDSVFHSPDLKFRGHAWGPLFYQSQQDALYNLLPNLGIPSDHAPVVVDFELPEVQAVMSEQDDESVPGALDKVRIDQRKSKRSPSRQKRLNRYGMVKVRRDKARKAIDLALREVQHQAAA
eukprot:6249062-Prymnesium_polylepis.1